jgi:preprotein translocase subunit Sec61beta
MALPQQALLPAWRRITEAEARQMIRDRKLSRCRAGSGLVQFWQHGEYHDPKRSPTVLVRNWQAERFHSQQRWRTRLPC